MNLDSLLDNLQPQLDWQREIYRRLHRNPELSMQETGTAEIIEAELSGLGLTVQRFGGTGRVVVIENGDGPTVLARADIDALPVTEQTGLDYTSTVDGVMHACGHDMHTAALIGAIRVLAENRDAWHGTYIGLFQPAEETGVGADAMIDDGLVAAIPRPEVALAQHILPLPAGRIATAAGPILSAAESIKVTVFGRGGHGSMPHLAIDPVVLAASIVMRLQSIVAREVPPDQFAVVTVGALNAGTKSNIIPDRAELRLNTRSYDPQVRTQLLTAIERIVRAECQAAGSPQEPTFEYYDEFPLTSNDADVNATVTAAFRGYFGDDAVLDSPPVTASEDFSAIPAAFGIPYDYWFIGSVDPQHYQAAVDAGTVAADIPANHSPFFAPVIDPTLEIGTKAQVVAALAYLSD